MNPKNWTHRFSFVTDLRADTPEGEAFLKAAKESGMRETKCRKCQCTLLTRGNSDYCPPCRELS